MEAVFPFWAPRANQNARPSTLGQFFLLIVTNSERVPNYEHPFTLTIRFVLAVSSEPSRTRSADSESAKLSPDMPRWRTR